jgi:hypothetical protein
VWGLNQLRQCEKEVQRSTKDSRMKTATPLHESEGSASARKKHRESIDLWPLQAPAVLAPKGFDCPFALRGRFSYVAVSV